MAYCTNCGKQFITGSVACPYCETKVSKDGVIEAPKTKRQLEDELEDAEIAYNEPTYVGPVVLFFIGLLTAAIFIGFFLMGCAVLWQLSRWSDAGNKYQKIVDAKRALRRLEVI